MQKSIFRVNIVFFELLRFKNVIFRKIQSSKHYLLNPMMLASYVDGMTWIIEYFSISYVLFEISTSCHIIHPISFLYSSFSFTFDKPIAC